MRSFTGQYWPTCDFLSPEDIFRLQQSGRELDRSIVLGVLLTCYDAALFHSSRPLPACFSEGEAKLLSSRLRSLVAEDGLRAKLTSHVKLAGKFRKLRAGSAHPERVQFGADLFVALLEVELRWLGGCHPRLAVTEDLVSRQVAGASDSVN